MSDAYLKVFDGHRMDEEDDFVERVIKLEKESQSEDDE